MKILHHSRRVILITAVMLVASLLVSLCAKAVQESRTRRVAGAAGNLIEVRDGGDFQAALNSARGGDTIVLQAGAKFQGQGDKGFLFPAKDCTDYITVTTSSPSGLPMGRVEMSHAAAMPKILPPSSGGTTYAAMTFPTKSKFWKVVGVEVTTLPGQPYASVLIDVGPNASLRDAPSDRIFDRVYVHSLEDGTDHAE